MKKTWKPLKFGVCLGVSLMLVGQGGVAFATEMTQSNTEGNEFTQIEEELHSLEQVEGDYSLTITANFFPDEAFRNELKKQFDNNNDNQLTDSERKAIKAITISSAGVKDVTGIEHFPNLKVLSIYNNQIENFNKIKHPALAELSCSGNAIVNLNVSGFPNLQNLNCGEEKLASIDVSCNPELKILSIRDASCKEINVSKNTKLETLFCLNTPIEQIDLSKNTALTSLALQNNQLTELNVTANTQLTHLSCVGNRLTKLDISKNTKLVSLSCGENQLTAMDISKNKELVDFYCFDNPITNLDLTNNSKLQFFSCTGCQLKSLDVSKNTELIMLNCEENQLTQIDVTKNEKLRDLRCGVRIDEGLLGLNGSNVYALDEKKDSSSNSFKTLDLSKNVELKNLECAGVGLRKLDLSSNNELSYLDCNNNRIVSLDLSRLNSLNNVQLQDNYLQHVTFPADLAGTLNSIVLLDVSNNMLSEERIQSLHQYITNISYLTTSGQIKKECSAWGLVDRLYAQCLGRTASEDEMVYWYERIADPKQTGTKTTGIQAAAFFVFSQECSGKYVTDEQFIIMLYQSLMGRKPASSEVNYWKSVLDSGLSRQYIFKAFAESNEFTSICNACNVTRGSYSLSQVRDKNPKVAKFVQRLYVNCMGRKGDEAGLNYWCNMLLTKKMKPVAVAELFFALPEFTNKNLSNTEYVKTLYRTFMDREADASGLKYWVNRLDQGEPRNNILKSFAGCNEFKKIVADLSL